ncbi:hypothetical protein Trydic_g13697 [Trypoxylus dichotomus]
MVAVRSREDILIFHYCKTKPFPVHIGALTFPIRTADLNKSIHFIHKDGPQLATLLPSSAPFCSFDTVNASFVILIVVKVKALPFINAITTANEPSRDNTIVTRNTWLRARLQPILLHLIIIVSIIVVVALCQTLL